MWEAVAWPGEPPPLDRRHPEEWEDEEDEEDEDGEEEDFEVVKTDGTEILNLRIVTNGRL